MHEYKTKMHGGVGGVEEGKTQIMHLKPMHRTVSKPYNPHTGSHMTHWGVTARDLHGERLNTLITQV